MPKSLTEDTGVSSWSRKGTLMFDTLPRSCPVPKTEMSLALLGVICNSSRIHVFNHKGAVDLGIVNV